MNHRPLSLSVASLALFCLVALGGCASPRLTAQSPSFSPDAIDHAAIVLTLAVGADSGLLSTESNDELRDTLRNRVQRALPLQAAYFGTEVTSPPLEGLSEGERRAALGAYDAVLEATLEAVENGEPLDVAVPPELARLSEPAGARYLLALRTVGWRKTTANRVLSVLASDYSPSAGIGLEALLFDATAARVLWFGQHTADLDPAKGEDVEAVAAALAFELYTGRRVSAFSFLPWTKDLHVTAWLDEGGRVSGRLIGRDGFDVVLREQDGEEIRIPLTSVRSIRSSSVGRVFPSQRRASSQVGLF